MAQTLSIILAQYYPDKMQLRHTLDSLLIQDTYDFELIIADDGSPEDYWDDTRAYLAAHGFTNVKLSKNKVNQGTVTNMLHAVELASGQWIAGISPGDYVYDASTIRWVLDMLRKDAPQVAFGKVRLLPAGKSTARWYSCPGRRRLTALPTMRPTTITRLSAAMCCCTMTASAALKQCTSAEFSWMRCKR